MIQTTIDHSIRVKLKLSLQEYCIMDFITGYLWDHKTTPGVKDYVDSIGVNPAEEKTQSIISGLVGKGLLSLDHIPTSVWNNEFKANTNDFSKLWDVHRKGNKKTAQERFNKVIKRVSFEELESKLRQYVKSNEFQYLKGLDVWLNPSKEHWNDPIVVKPEFTEEKKGMVM